MQQAAPLSSNPLFQSPRIIFHRAMKHFDELSQKLSQYINSKPYTRVTNVSDDTGREIHRIKFHTSIPLECAAISREVIAGFRDTLDHIVYASVATITRSDPKHTKFPFGKTTKDFENEMSKGKDLIPDEIKKVIRRFEPYEGGGANGLLWAFNELRNKKVYRTLVPAVLVPRRTVISGMRLDGGYGVRLRTPVWDPMENEIVYLETGPGKRSDYRVEMDIIIAFNGEDPLMHIPAVDALNDFRNIVCDINEDIEKVTTEILGIASS